LVVVVVPGEDGPEPNNTGLFGSVEGSVLEQANRITNVRMMNQAYLVLFIVMFS
jgi:hypothetical protein